jgi:glycerol-3-phosphate acyltransferase PlsX
MGLGRINGIGRAAMTAVGVLAGNLFLLVDAGANTDTKLAWLQQYAIMGNIYAKRVLNIKNPRVGTLANGEEDGKGDELVREANAVFRAMTSINYIGNVEPKDLTSGKVDVIVCDGLVGNILIKTYETAIRTVFTTMRDELKADLRSQIGGGLARPALRRVYKQVDPSQYGGTPLLGVNGVVIITHGSSTAEIIRDAIKQARIAVQNNIAVEIETGLKELGLSEE